MIYNLPSDRQWLEENTTRGTRKISKESRRSRKVGKVKRTQFKKIVTKAEGVGRRYQTKAQKCCSRVKWAQSKTS